MTKLHNGIFPAKGVRVRRESLGAAFPETLFYPEAYEVANPAAIARLYAETDAKFEAGFEGLDAEESAKREAAAGMIRRMETRRAVELLKVPLLVSLARDGIAEGNAVVIFTSFRETVAHLRASLECDSIHGGQDPLQRQEVIEKFQQNATSCVVANIDAGGVGISLHDTTGTKRPRLALLCPTDKAVALIQALGRVHRIGGGPSTQILVLASGTVEETIRRNVEKKISNINTLNDGDLTL